MISGNEQIQASGVYSESTKKILTGLKRFTSVLDAEYPPTDKFNNYKYEYPQYAMLVEEPNKPLLLFTPEHDELLFLIEELELLQKNPNRVVVNLDDHDDVRLGRKNISEINAANWGRHGRSKDFWGGVIHVSQNNIPGVTNKKLSDLVPFGLLHPQNTVQRLLKFIGERPYIFSIDADEYSQFVKNQIHNIYESFAQMNFREFIPLLTSKKTPELIHFTSSPAFSPADGARKAWDIVRETYIGIN